MDGLSIVCSTGSGLTTSSGLGRSNEDPRAGGPGGGGAVPCGNLSRSRPDSMPPVIGVTGAIGVSPDSDLSDPSDSSVPSDSSEDVVPKQESVVGVEGKEEEEEEEEEGTLSVGVESGSGIRIGKCLRHRLVEGGEDPVKSTTDVAHARPTGLIQVGAGTCCSVVSSVKSMRCSGGGVLC